MPCPLGGWLSPALPCFSNGFPLGRIYFLAPCLYVCGLQQRARREKGTFWKGSSSCSFHRGRNSKRRSSREPSGPGLPWLVDPQKQEGV